LTLLQVGSQNISVLVLYIVVFIGIFYFMMLRPQQIQAKRRREMLSKIKKGDRVVVSGFHATVADVNADELTVELAPNMPRIKADRSAVNYVRGKKDRDAGSSSTP